MRAKDIGVLKQFTVYLVDDDLGVLKGLTRLVRAKNYNVKGYSSPELFLQEHDVAVPGCAVLDVSMPAIDGLDLQLALTALDGCHRPVIFVTGKGDIPTSVRAMKAGAIDFLTKPVKAEALFDAISRAELRDAEFRKGYSELESINTKMMTLTPREREVLMHVVRGRLNKQIAGDLGTVEKTIKVHRSRVMEKLACRSVADLVRMAVKLELTR